MKLMIVARQRQLNLTLSFSRGWDNYLGSMPASLSPQAIMSSRATSWLDPRIKRSLKNLYDEWRILRNHRKGVRYVREKCIGVHPLRVHVGCGTMLKAGWLNTDLWPGPWATPDIALDVSRPFPFDTDSVTEIYSEHMFEHLDYPDAVSLFLSECYRVLEPGGVLTIGVPDLDFHQDLYEQRMKASPLTVEMKPNYIFGHPLEALNHVFHQQGEHKFLYNETYLLTLLKHFGFAEARKRPFDPAMDSEHRREETLYVVAVKPR
jgi:predicted SAM-dependent methyltransferase